MLLFMMEEKTLLLLWSIKPDYQLALAVQMLLLASEYQK